MSIRELETAGARYLTARAELQLANITPQRGAYLQRSARARAETDADDPAWRRLLNGARMQVRVLGVPQVEIEGRSVSFGTRHELDALAALALAGADGLSAERLCDMLWPNDIGASSRHRLDVVVSSLRRHLLPTTRLTRERGVLHLSLDEDECDVTDAVGVARRFLSGQSHNVGDAERACARLQSLLLGGALEEWVVEAQRDLEGLRVQLHDRLSESGFR
jgi:DNA-binding SARP family transcriptional activator